MGKDLLISLLAGIIVARLFELIEVIGKHGKLMPPRTYNWYRHGLLTVLLILLGIWIYNLV